MFLRKLVAVAAGAALIAVALPSPASATVIELKSPMCGTVPGPGLHIDLHTAPTTSGFSATGSAYLCHASAIAMAIELQFAGVGVTARPPGGGPIVGAPSEIVYNRNDVSTTGHSAAPSGLNQSVVVNVSAQALTVGAQFVASCQAVVELISGSEYKIEGC